MFPQGGCTHIPAAAEILHAVAMSPAGAAVHRIIVGVHAGATATHTPARPRRGLQNPTASVPRPARQSHPRRRVRLCQKKKKKPHLLRQCRQCRGGLYRQQIHPPRVASPPEPPVPAGTGADGDPACPAEPLRPAVPLACRAARTSTAFVGRPLRGRDCSPSRSPDGCPLTTRGCTGRYGERHGAIVCKTQADSKDSSLGYRTAAPQNSVVGAHRQAVRVTARYPAWKIHEQHSKSVGA